MNWEGALIPRCKTCKRFVSNIVLTVNGFGDTHSVKGDCKRHGRVDVIDWDWDMFPEAG